MTAPTPKPTPTLACRACGSDRVQTFPHIQTDDGKTVCKCLACGKPWAEVLS